MAFILCISLIKVGGFMGAIGLIGRRFGWSEKTIKRASGLLDIIYLIGFIAMLYYSVTYMGGVHECVELAKADCGGWFGNNITACCPCNLTLIP
jgi:hypothetical protein